MAKIFVYALGHSFAVVIVVRLHWDEDSKFFGSVDGIVHRGSSAQSDTGKIVAKKMGAAGQVVCSISTSPDQMVLMFQHLHGNYTLDELAGMDILFWTLKSPNISKGALVEPELKKFQNLLINLLLFYCYYHH